MNNKSTKEKKLVPDKIEIITHLRSKEAKQIKQKANHVFLKESSVNNFC